MASWQVTLTCKCCGKKEVQGPLELGPRDEISIGQPPDGWLRIEVLSSEKVLPKQLDQMVEAINNHPIPDDFRAAQLEIFEMGCPAFFVALDICDECTEKPETLGSLGAIITQEKKRLLELDTPDLDSNLVDLMDAFPRSPPPTDEGPDIPEA